MHQLPALRETNTRLTVAIVMGADVYSVLETPASLILQFLLSTHLVRLSPLNSNAYAQFIPQVQIFPDDVNPQGTFYIVSAEKDMTGMANPEAWCDSTAVIGTPDAVIAGSVYGNIGGWVRVQNGSYAYGSVNFL